MPTLQQLQAETWWSREIVTEELRWLGAELCRRTGRPADAFGTKGNAAHLRGAHRSQEWILRSAYCTNRAYTVQAGLTGDEARYVAGVDWTPGNVDVMIAQSRRLMAAVKSGGLEAVRELYCNVDGDQVVDGWDNVRDRAASSDSSHLWHWHLSLDRRAATDLALMRRIVDVATGVTAPKEQEDPMPFVAKDTNTGQYFVCDLITSRPVPAGAVRDTLYLAKQLNFGHGVEGAEWTDSGWTRVGWAEAAFGTVLKPGATVDVQALAAALGPLLGVDQAAVVTALESDAGQAALVRAENTAEDS